tara:strand:+ start:633 stop:920 length:288 start_codon:yes stop_codon:yes gene_type:complete
MDSWLYSDWKIADADSTESASSIKRSCSGEHEYRTGLCVLHLPTAVVDELFDVHDHQVSMQDNGIAPYGRDQSMNTAKGVPNLLKLVTNTNQFGK